MAQSRKRTEMQAYVGQTNTREQIYGTPALPGLSSPSRKQILLWAAWAPQGTVR